MELQVRTIQQDEYDAVYPAKVRRPVVSASQRISEALLERYPDGRVPFRASNLLAAEFGVTRQLVQQQIRKLAFLVDEKLAESERAYSKCIVCGESTGSYNKKQRCPAHPRPLPEHGTRQRYARGCACTDCRKANAERMREFYARKRLEFVPADHVHGVYRTYQTYGCRCAPCTKANTDFNRPHVLAYAWREQLKRAQQ